MLIEKAIEILSDSKRGLTTHGPDFKEAMEMGKKALCLLAFDRALRLDDASLELLLGASRASGATSGTTKV